MIYRIIVSLVLVGLVVLALIAASDHDPEQAVPAVPAEQSNPTNFNL